MAEKTSHDVVNETGSASAPAPADVAANQPTIASVADGTNTTHIDNSSIDAALAMDSDAVTQSQEVNEKAADANNTAQLTIPDGEGKELANSTLDTASQSGSQVGDVSLELSTASDTEGTRSDAPGPRSTENHHIRTNSVKKPATFSKVSVTKNFLAKAASPSPTVAASKPGDKPSPLNAPSQPAAARPRLVAKTASSLQSMQRPRVGESAGAPDASKVWNKNRRKLRVAVARWLILTIQQLWHLLHQRPLRTKSSNNNTAFIWLRGCKVMRTARRTSGQISMRTRKIGRRRLWCGWTARSLA